MEDFNIRTPDELQYVDSPIITDELDLLLQELDILFNTDENEVLGNSQMGLGLERYLGKYTINNFQLRTLIINKIQENCFMAEKFNVDVEVNFVNGRDASDILFVDVIVSNQRSNNKLKRLTFVYR